MIQRGATAEEDDEPVELLTKPREYQVKFSFPNPPPLSPPILGAYGELEFAYSYRKFNANVVHLFAIRRHIWLQRPTQAI